MGLDNGIILKEDPEKVKDYFFWSTNGFLDKETEICYWRKCWNIRKVIRDVLHLGDKDEFSYLLDADDIKPIIKGITNLMSKESWEADNGSIWDFDEICETLVTNLCNLKLLQKYLEDHPDAQAYFYDSY